MAERCLALTGQPVADKQLPKIRGLDHRGKKLASCFSDSDDLDVCFIHVFLHTDRPTPCCAGPLQWILCPHNWKQHRQLWQMGLRFTILFHLSVVPGPRAVKLSWIKIKKLP